MATESLCARAAFVLLPLLGVPKLFVAGALNASVDDAEWTLAFLRLPQQDLL